MGHKLSYVIAGLGSVRAKMWLAAALLVTAVGALAIVPAVAIHELASMPEALERHAYSVERALRDIRATTVDMEAETGPAADAPSPVAPGSRERMREVRARLALVAERFTVAPQLVVNTQRAFEAWETAVGVAVKAASAGSDDHARKVAQQDAALRLRSLRMSLDGLIAAADAAGAARRAESAATGRGWILRYAVVLLLSMMVLVATIRMIAESILRPILEVNEALRRTVEDKVHRTVPHVRRNDEIGEVARTAQALLEHADAIRHSNIDAVTGLPTRGQFLDHIEILRLDPQNAGRPGVLLHIDLDRFGEINDSYGRGVGDECLRRVAEAVRHCLAAGDFMARVGGDSFAVLALGQEGEAAFGRLARHIRARIGRSFEHGGRTIRLSCCIGVAAYDPEGASADLLSRAESASAEARKLAVGTTAIHTDEMAARLRRHRETVEGLKRALTADEIVPYFQPQINAQSGELTGFEALARWNRPEHGVLQPWQFIGIAEEAGLMRVLGEAVATKTLRQLAEWRALGHEVPRISLNVTPCDLRRPDFADRMALQTESARLAPSDICIEMLESAMIEDVEDPIIQTLRRLADLGFPIELDDFGTGHAAISTLHLVGLSAVKIDRSFVMQLHERPDRRKLTRGMLRIAQALRISAVAEGVESDAERRLLVDLGCEVVQGFGIAPPMSAEDATRWLEQYRPSAVRGRVFARSA